jgi:hypothetical protein
MRGTAMATGRSNQSCSYEKDWQKQLAILLSPVMCCNIARRGTLVQVYVGVYGEQRRAQHNHRTIVAVTRTIRPPTSEISVAKLI